VLALRRSREARPGLVAFGSESEPIDVVEGFRCHPQRPVCAVSGRLQMNDHDDLPQPVGKARSAAIDALRDQETTLDSLAGAVRACVDVLPVDGASVSLMSSWRAQETLCASDEIAARIESVQFSLGEGPCFEAFATCRPVLVPDLLQASALGWPVFTTSMDQLPVGAIFAFPLQADAVSIGVMDLYRRRPGWLSDDEISLASRISSLVTTVVLGLQLSDDTDSWRAMLTSSRVQVHQATGMIMETFGVCPDEALARLRGHAFVMDRSVEDLAEDVVTRRLSLLDLDR
jgi:hypothetical protein